MTVSLVQPSPLWWYASWGGMMLVFSGLSNFFLSPEQHWRHTNEFSWRHYLLYFQTVLTGVNLLYVSFLGYSDMHVCLHGTMSSQTSITTQLQVHRKLLWWVIPSIMYDFNNVTVWEELFLQDQAPYFISVWWKGGSRPNWEQVWGW